MKEMAPKTRTNAWRYGLRISQEEFEKRFPNFDISKLQITNIPNVLEIKPKKESLLISSSSR